MVLYICLAKYYNAIFLTFKSVSLKEFKLKKQKKKTNKESRTCIPPSQWLQALPHMQAV